MRSKVAILLLTPSDGVWIRRNSTAIIGLLGGGRLIEHILVTKPSKVAKPAAARQRQLVGLVVGRSISSHHDVQ